MKTIKIIFAVASIALIVSCSTYYRMVTTLERDGSAHRDIYALGDSAFIAGNSSKNPFLFDLSADWSVSCFTTSIKHNFFGDESELNVKISKDATYIEQYSKEMQCSEEVLSLAAPEELLFKKFRWFYTNYSFKAVYKQLQYEAPVPIGNYLSEEEQRLWTQGGMNNYKAANGFEMNDYLSEISNKFIAWYSRNCFEISLACIKELTTGYDLDMDKENIYKQIHVKDLISDINPQTVCMVLDAFYKTTYFSALNKTNKEILDDAFEIATLPGYFISKVIGYELVIPGEILHTNAPIINADTLVWKVDGMRLLFDDYSLTAEYRTINKWAFLLTGLLLILAIGSIILLVRKRYFYSFGILHLSKKI